MPDRVLVTNDPVIFVDPKGLIIGSTLTKVIGRVMRESGQHVDMVGKAADSMVGVSIELSGGVDAPGAIGYASDALQAYGGAQTLGLASGIALYSSVPGAVPVGLALLGGAELGFAFNGLYERWSGQSLGGDLYDWWHRDDCEK